MKIMTIRPYFINGQWVFDDDAAGLVQEPFVRGASEMITRLVESKPVANPYGGFEMRFSAMPFDGFDVRLRWMSPAHASAALKVRHGIQEMPKDGNWYAANVAGQEMIAWLCPALFKYFDRAPKEIYVEGRAI